MPGEIVIIDRLLADTTLANLIGNRVWPVAAPQNSEVPYVVCTRISGSTVNGATGPSGTSNWTAQVDCIALTYRRVKEIADAVRASLNGHFSGGKTPDISAMLVAERDDIDPPVHGEGQGVFRVIQDYSIWHN